MFCCWNGWLFLRNEFYLFSVFAVACLGVKTTTTAETAGLICLATFASTLRGVGRMGGVLFALCGLMAPPSSSSGAGESCLASLKFISIFAAVC